MPENSDFDCCKFHNRSEAAIKLIDLLPKTRMKSEEWIVIAISAGAVSIANMIANNFALHYDLIFTEAIYAPNNNECVIAMVSETQEIIIDNHLVDSFGISLDYVYGEARRKYEERILKYIYKYRKGESISQLNNKNVLLVDEGTETGMTAMCALKTVINENIKTVSFATPIIPTDVYQRLEMITDEIYAVYKIKDFIDVGYYYEDLQELEPKGIKEIIQNSTQYLPLNKRRNLDGM